MASSDSSSGLSRRVFLIPEIFLYLALVGALLADIAAWTGRQRLLLAALLIVVWAGVQGLVISLALSRPVKGRPLTLPAVLAALVRTVISIPLFLLGAVYTGIHPGLTGRLVFIAVGGTMLAQLPSLAQLRKRIKREGLPQS